MLPVLPAVLGNGVGGVVVAIGPDVDAALVGRRVITALNGLGGYAEHASADADAVVHIPDELATDQAAALLADGRTATMLVRAAAIRAGDKALVLAAAGGVGSLLVQLARMPARR
jgi:NADPH2:quinone reductase